MCVRPLSACVVCTRAFTNLSSDVLCIEFMYIRHRILMPREFVRGARAYHPVRMLHSSCDQLAYSCSRVFKYSTVLNRLS